MPEAEYELEMPFIVCASQGGPYDDSSFVAGYALGLIDADLIVSGKTASDAALNYTVRTASLPQVDLIAMRNRYTVEREDGDAEWTLVRLVRGTDAV